jgi:hypothetical protein
MILIWPLENMPRNPAYIYTTISSLLPAMQWMVTLKSSITCIGDGNRCNSDSSSSTNMISTDCDEWTHKKIINTG